MHPQVLTTSLAMAPALMAPAQDMSDPRIKPSAKCP
jgi:hypothetical protein